MEKPQQLDAERAVIKCLLNNQELLYDIQPRLTPEMFFGIDNALVFKTIIEAESVPDVVLIKTELKRANQFDAIGGETYFEQIANSEVLETHFKDYVLLISDAYISRSVIEAGRKIEAAGYTKSVSDALGVMFNETSNILDAVNIGISSPSIRDLMAKEFTAFLERLQNPGSSGISTGFTDYDLLTGGLYETDLVIIAARPSAGKTALALRVLLNLAKQNVPGLFFSYEMSDKQLMQRLLSMESGVELAKIRNGMVQVEEYEKVAAAANTIGNLPIYINNNPVATISDIDAETKREVRNHGIRIVVVDYLQLMPYRIEFATQDLGDITRRLKGLNMSTNTVGIALSQLNRLVEARAQKIPILSDLRQSGNIEEHADAVWMLYREEMYEPTEENKGHVDLLIRKNRNGPIGVLPLGFSARNVNFFERP